MKRRGVTLVETLVGLTLFALLLAVLAEAVRYGLRAHTKGEAARQAQAQARRILDQITNEISTGVVLDTLLPDGVSSNPRPRDFLSAVLWPEPYEENNPGSFSPPANYPVERVTENNVPIDRVRDRLILTRPGVGLASANFNERDYSQFVYVEYVVPPPDPSGAGQHLLLRRVYRVSSRPSGPPDGNDSVQLGIRHVKPEFFQIPVYVKSNPLGIFSNANTTVAGLPPAQQAAQQVVAQLTSDTDRISFSVEHARNREVEGLDPTRMGRFAYYDPSLFTVTVNVSIGRGAPGQYMAVRSLSGQARVKSGQ